MEILFLGHSAFRLKGKTAVAVAEINSIGIEGSEFKIQGPGEYEIKDVSVIGVADGDKNVIYVLEIDGLRICYVGKVGKKLTEGQLEDMGSIDIVLIPVGGEGEADPKLAVEITRQIDPWVVIPSLGSTELFLKEIGKEGVETISKYVVTQDKLPTDLTVVVLEKK